MKKAITITAILFFSAFGALAQGYVLFNTRVTGSVVEFVYNRGSKIQGPGYSATLWAANGAGQSESSLTLVPGSLTSFRTGATFAGTPAPLILQVPGIPAGGTGTFQIRAWNNLNGTIGSYAAAVAAGSPAGESDLFDVSGLGAGQDLPADLHGVHSFSFELLDHPGPLTIALTGTNTAVVLWPYDSPSVALEENPTLGTSNWTSVTNTVSTNSSLSWVLVPVSNSNKFYRLKQ